MIMLLLLLLLKTHLLVNLNIHQIASFIPVFDESFPVQDFLQEIRDARDLGSWPDVVTLKVAKSKLQDRVAEIVCTAII